MEFSNSFCWLSSEQTAFVFYLSTAFCVLAALLSAASSVLDRATRRTAYFLLVLSLVLVPAAMLYDHHVAATTVPAVLRK